MRAFEPTAGKLQGEVLVAKGFTSEIFSWSGGRVLKLYLDRAAVQTVEREYTITRAVHRAGLPAPAAHGIVEVDGRYGIVFDRVEGITLLRDVERRPWTLFRAARWVAELHAQLHDCIAPPELPSQRAQLEEWVRHATNLSAARKEAARRQLAASGEGDRLCHGDFHPGNILLSPRGPIIIDWETATRGHPLADVAATSVLFECANLPLTTSLHARVLMKLFRNLLHAAYLKRYLQLRGGSLAEIALWRVPQRAGIADLLSTGPNA